MAEGAGVKKAVYPGSFDPITNGHLDVIRRGSAVFGDLVVAVARNLRKAPLFDVEERLAMIRETVQDIDNVQVVAFDGLVVDLVRQQGTNVILRGIRTMSDFEYEFQMALTNRELNRDVETVFVMSSQDYSFIHASVIKEVVSLGGSASRFVPAYVEEKLREKLLPGG